VKTQTLGKSTLTSSRLAYGCMRINAGQGSERLTPGQELAARAAVLAAWEAGFTHFDHADIYGNGVCEEIFGRVLRDTPGMRDQVLIASKCGIRWRGDPEPSAPHRWDFSKEHILRSCEGSLRRLRTDRIDLYMLHRPDYLADPQEVAAAFSQLSQQGKVLHFGVSNFRPSLLAMVQGACPMPLVVNQVEIHLGRLDCLEDGTLDQCLRKRITPVSWSPLAGGMLGGSGSVDSSNPRAAGLQVLLQVLDAIASDHGVSRAVVSLAWLLKHPAGIIPVVGSAAPERIREAAKADSLELTREEWYRILVAAQMRPLP
jgi:predicted oxidoreductase